MCTVTIYNDQQPAGMSAAKFCEGAVYQIAAFVLIPFTRLEHTHVQHVTQVEYSMAKQHQPLL